MSKEAMKLALDMLLIFSDDAKDELIFQCEDAIKAICKALAQPEQEQEHDLNKVAQAMYEAYEEKLTDAVNEEIGLQTLVDPWSDLSRKKKNLWIAAAKEAAKQFGVTLTLHDQIAYQAGVAHGYEKAKGELGK